MTEELAALSFFHDDFSFQKNQHIVAKLQEEDDEQESLKRPQHLLGFLKHKNLQHFVIIKANTFFELLRLDSKIFQTDPTFWSKIERFQSAKFIVKNLKRD